LKGPAKFNSPLRGDKAVQLPGVWRIDFCGKAYRQVFPGTLAAL
jgi:hypothetical protein